MKKNKKITLVLISMIMTMTAMAQQKQGFPLLWGGAGDGVSYHYQQVGNVKVFYREAGNPQKPTILLIHGFPSSSVQFRELMPELMDDYHLIAPDMPGFGQTDAPVKPFYEYTFDNLAKTIDAFIDSIGLKHFSMYIFDYQSNVILYPEMQKYLRDNQPPLLAVWGKNDPSFIPAGAEAFKRDLPKAVVTYVDSGHFALESHHTEIAALIKKFLKDNKIN